MDQVFQYHIPLLHPILVHFPVALLIVAASFVALWLVRDRYSLLISAVCIQLIGVVATIGSYLTGEEMKAQSEGVPIIDSLVGLHESAAVLSIWLGSVALTAMAAATFLHRRDLSHAGTRLWIRLIVFILAMMALAAISWTAHIGGTMVWGTVS